MAKLFAGIFITIIPVLAMLQAGSDGRLRAARGAGDRTRTAAPTTPPISGSPGGLSSFLDNAPTYLVFFELAGGDAAAADDHGRRRRSTAISAGAVFMGANSYIGNAPNFMVYAIAREGGVRMPSFFGYMLWSGAILLPVFLLTTLVFF